MDNIKVNLVAFDGSDFNKGAGFLKTTAWYFANALLVRASWNPFMGIKVAGQTHQTFQGRRIKLFTF